MITFTTKYGQAIMRVMNHYPPGSPSLFVALEAVVQTAMTNTISESRDMIAQSVCDERHPPPAKGLACRSCYEALESSKVGSVDDPAASETADDKAQREKIMADVAKMIAGGNDE